MAILIVSRLKKHPNGQETKQPVGHFARINLQNERIELKTTKNKYQQGKSEWNLSPDLQTGAVK